MGGATVVLYPCPGVGHIISMVELGKLITTHCPSLTITILITPAPLDTPAATAYIAAVAPSITFHHLPAAPLLPTHSSELVDLAFLIPELSNAAVHNALVTISDTTAIKAVVLDFFTNAAFEISTNLGLPTYYFYTSGAFALCAFLCYPAIHKTTSKNIIDMNCYLDYPGLPPIHSSDMPTSMSYRDSYSYKCFISAAMNMGRSSGVIANTFEAFEGRAVDTLRDGRCFPCRPIAPVYLVGPLIASGNQTDPTENGCLKWLSSQPSKSVVFLCFGSLGLFRKEQLKEIAIGLEKSGQRFLWVVRDPPQNDETGSGFDDLFPEGFLERTVDKGLVVKNWAPQKDILSHDSVGGFVSHCGWNSALEAVVGGVPMVAWPLYAEQKMNRVFLVKEMKVALRLKMEADGFVAAEELAEKVRELMEGEEGRSVRERILGFTERAKAAVADGGSSLVELGKLTESWTTV